MYDYVLSNVCRHYNYCDGCAWTEYDWLLNHCSTMSYREIALFITCFTDRALEVEEVIKVLKEF